MCLSCQEDFPLRVKNGTITAWKVILQNDSGEYMPYMWKLGLNKATETSILSDSCGGFYSSGFHCFSTRASARSWRWRSGRVKIIKVYINPKDVVALGHQLGHQSGYKIIVAKQVTVKSLKHQR